MKKFIFVLFLCSLNCLAAEKAVYKGTLVDAVTQWPTGKYSLKELRKIIEAAGISRAGISINTFNPSPKLVENSSKEIDSDKNFYKGSPKYFHFVEALNSKNIDSLIVEIKNNHYKYISEIMYRHADKKQGFTTSKGERTIDPLSKESIYLMTKLNKNFPKLPIFIHWEFYNWKEDAPKFSKLFNSFPSLTFIINHIGFGSAEQAKALLLKHHNVYFTISKRNTPFAYFQNSKVTQGPPLIDKNKVIDSSWKALLVNYNTRFLFATDSHKDYMWDNYTQTVNDYREILGQLPLAIAQNIAYKNAEIIFKIAP